MHDIVSLMSSSRVPPGSHPQGPKRRRGGGGESPQPQPLPPAAPSAALPFPASDPEERIAALRRNSSVLYDCLLHHAMQWGSLSACWGSQVEGGERVLVVAAEGAAPPAGSNTSGSNSASSPIINSNAFPEEFNEEHALFFSGRTDGMLEEDSWVGQPAELFVARVALPKPRTTRRMQLRFHETNKSGRVHVVKRILHPGEVNRVRCVPSQPNTVVTTTDSETVFLWDTKLQPHRTLPEDAPSSGPAAKKKNAKPERYKCNIPDAMLVGHTAGLKYALDTTRNRVLAGSTNGVVLSWDVSNSIVDRNVAPRAVFSKNGHSGSAEDCCFSPADENIIMSVSLDRSVLLWDSRTAEREGPVSRVAEAHADDINCCSWSPADPTKLLTGGSDRMANIFDTRKLAGGALHRVTHSSSLVNVRWSPHSPHFFVTADENSWVTVFSTSSAAGASPPLPPGPGGVDMPRIIFQHLGHRSPAVDLSWNTTATCPEDMVLASVSDDSQDEARGGGGTLQVWRVSEFATRNPRTDIKWLAEVEEAMLTTTKPGVGGGGPGGPGSVTGGPGGDVDSINGDGGSVGGGDDRGGGGGGGGGA